MKRIQFNPQAFEDLQDIKAYISEDSEQEAEKVIREILADVEKLAIFPEIGTYLKNKIRCPSKYRYIMTYSYATVYYIEQNEVVILTVLHLARDFSALRNLF